MSGLIPLIHPSIFELKSLIIKSFKVPNISYQVSVNTTAMGKNLLGDMSETFESQSTTIPNQTHHAKLRFYAYYI